MSAAETPRLFSTLPTLCSTPVATSAMPASREASRNCDCRSRLRSSCNTWCVTSQDTPRMRSGLAGRVAENARVRLEVHRVAERRDDAKAERAGLLVLGHGALDRVEHHRPVFRMRHRDHGIRLQPVVHARRAQRFDLVLRPQRLAVRDVEFPGRDAGGARREREEILAVLQGGVHALEAHRVLARLRHQVRVVHRGDQRERQNAERDQADGAREPVVVERRATQADTNRRRASKRPSPV